VDRARKKSNKLIECEELLREAQASVDRQRDEELCKRIGSFLADLSSELSAESK
jgi:hypothetical protein